MFLFDRINIIAFPGRIMEADGFLCQWFCTSKSSKIRFIAVFRISLNMRRSNIFFMSFSLITSNIQGLDGQMSSRGESNTEFVDLSATSINNFRGISGKLQFKLNLLFENQFLNWRGFARLLNEEFFHFDQWVEVYFFTSVMNIISF